MIVYTKQGQRELLPNLAAYSGGVYVFPFFGNETYTDPFDSSVWHWEGVTNDIDEILGVSQVGTPLLSVVSVSDCIASKGSFFWDDINGVLCVHWYNSIGDWSVAKQENRYSKISVGYSSGYSSFTNNVYDGQYYKPIIIGLTGLNVSVDPTKLGLISFDSSSITLADQENNFADVNTENIVGVPIWIYYTDEQETQLKDEDRIFTGFLNGIKHNRDSVTFEIVQSRFFENKPACRNTITIEEFNDAGNSEGKLKPVAWGDIRRGKLVLVNEDALTTSSSGSAIFLLADPEIGALRAISKIYDDEDNEITIDSFDLNSCTATITKAAGISVSNLKKYKWGGEGYNISGDYNNGLDIIKDAFLKIANVPFSNSTYDIVQWNDQTSLNNEPIGISVQSDKGFLEEITEPIMTSLQGVVQTIGDGRISFFSRNVDADPSEDIKNYNQVSDPIIEESTKELVSEILVEYSPDFVAKEPLQTVVRYSEVPSRFGIDTRDPISPVKTVLINESDAIATANEIAETSTTPERIVTTEKTTVNKEINIFNIVSIDTGEYGRESTEYGEVLSINPDYISKRQSYKCRIIPGYTPPIEIEGFAHSDGLNISTGHGIDGHGIYKVIRSY